MRKITSLTSAAARRIMCLLFMMGLVFSAAWAHGPGEGGDIEKSVSIAQWDIDPAGAGVTRLGSGNHVLKLNVSITPENAAAILAGGGAKLDIPFIVAHNSQRRIAVWTDLSGTAAEIGDYTFATPANFDAGKVVWTDPALMTGSVSASVKIPKALLYNEAAGKAASEIYLIFITDNKNDMSTETGNRGGSSRNNVNGVNLVTEFNIFEKIALSAIYTVPCPGDEEITIGKWSINPDDANAARIGSGNHVLRLGVNIAPDGIEAILSGGGGTLDIPFIVAHNSQRRIAVWTDLSGTAAEIGDYTFATPANFDAGKVVWTDPALMTGSVAASVKIPKALLYNEAAGKTASAIYIIFITDNKNDMSTETGNRGGSSRNNVNGVNLVTEFNIFKEIKLSGFIPCNCEGGKWLEETIFTHINLAPGANPSQIGFSWFTPKGYSRTAVLQLAKVSELVDGQMPVNPKSFNAVISAGTNLYDVNKVTVTGLEPDTAYAYRVGNGAEWSSNVFTFNTQNPDNIYKVIVFGDPQVGSSTALWESTVRTAVRSAPDAAFIISAGDQTNSNTLNEIDGYVMPPQLRSYPVMAIVGNHDNDLNSASEPDKVDVGYLALLYQWPNDGMKAGKQLGGWDYYFSYGNTLYISINSNEKDIEQHRAFMRQAVSSHPEAAWKVAVFHHDLYGTGDHAGTGYGDAAQMQADWSPFIDGFGIDVAFNGHDHIYARSKFIKGDEIRKLQMTAVFDQNLNQASPGAVILPDGVQYIALSTAGDKFYDPEAQDWVAYTPGRLGNPGASPAVPDVPEYTIMTIDGMNLILETYRVDTNKLTDSITLRKTALREDLAIAVPGAKAIERGDIQEPGWSLFQGAIAAAETVLASGTADVHNTFVALYESYFALRVPTNKGPLGNLITQVTNKLSSATEGKWEGQYPAGSKAELKAVLDTALPVYEKRLETQRATDVAFNALDSAFRNFQSMVSNIPIPWIFVHNVAAQGVTTVDLVDWMEDGRTYVIGNETKYFTHHTKQEFASGGFGGPRSEPVFGPANGNGGRGHNGAHITKTHIGEWIRYELNVTQSGSYRVRLGAANKTSTAQKILLRDTDQRTLAAFNVPANNPLPAAGWTSALMVNADKEIYLPAGNYVIELFFVNDGLNVNTRNDLYPDGADIDILTFERTGAAAAPVITADPAVYRLPMPPLIAAGAPIRQQGWGTPGSVIDQDEASAINMGANREGIPVEVFKAATHLVLELAAKIINANFQIQIQSDVDMDWLPNQSELHGATLDKYWDGEKLIIPLEDLAGYERWKNMESRGRLFVSFYNYGWNELNVMGAYFIVDPAKLSSVSAQAVTVPANIASALDAVVMPNGQSLNWRNSVVDLMKALGLNSSLAARIQLAANLKYSGADADGSAAKNTWLHEELMRILVANGGRLPPDIRN
ncbi:MAG: DUF3597 family protein [Treponema sp.]|nr:DUF3597 family protein [Treponema sp.]